MMPWINARVLHHLDMALLHRTRGHCALPALLAGLPLITLTTIGARSGRRRSSPLVGLPDGENIVVVASNFGERRHPGWYHNLRANPTATISAGGREGRFTAREATPAERDRLWRMGDAIYRGYAAYRRRAGGRSIPILILVSVAA